jgi:hypothetical protein
MTQKQYRTAQGKVVDIGALQLQNQHVRAVGNMSINAQGDLIDGNNRSIDSRNQQVARQYRKQIGNVRDDTVYSSTSQRQANEAKVVADITPPEDFEDDFVKSAAAPAPAATEGLAAAMARARTK